MAISHFIAHKISRLTPSDSATTQLRQDEVQLNGKVEECLRELKLNYIKKLGKIHGRFSSDTANHPVANWIQQCIDEQLSFVSLSHKAMQQFKLELEKTDDVIDAYVFFAQESFEHAQEFYVYVVHQDQALYLDGELMFTDVVFLDTQSASLAAKINLHEWQSEDSQLNYFSLQQWRGEKGLNDAFISFMGFTDKADIKEHTEHFLEAVDSYAATLPEEAAIETREKVVSYCLDQDKSGRRVNIAELSRQVNEDKHQEFEQHVRKTKPQLTPELIPDRTQLRQYIRISGRNDLLSMSFDSKCLGETIVYDADSDSLIITKIPSALKSRLIKHLKTP